MRMKMKMKRKALVICLLSAMGISGCAGRPAASAAPQQIETSAKGETVSEDDKDFAAHFNEFTINGKTLSIPCSYREIADAGFKINYAYKDILGVDADVDTTWSWKDDKDSSFGFDFTFPGNGKTDMGPLEECDAIRFRCDSESIGATDITFYGGINVHSTREDVAKVLDEVSADEAGAYYKRYLNDAYRSEIDIVFCGDQIGDIEIENSVAYRN